MSRSGLTSLVRLAAPAGYLAALLAFAALVLFMVVVGGGTISEAGTRPAFLARTLAALGSVLCVLAALVALFARLADRLGGTGLPAFLAAFAGTTLAAGATWWVFFAVALWRAGVFPRWMVGLLAPGALLAVVPMPSRTLLLAVAVAVLGHQVRLDMPAVAPR